jgi:heterodisulfide reductase subunit B
MNYLYYPGCSLKGAAIDYDESFRAVASALDIGVEEMKDWECCGATAAKSVDKNASVSLPLGTLKRAEKEGKDLLMLCPSCYTNLMSVKVKAQDDRVFKETHSLNQVPEIKQFLEVLAFDIGAEKLRERIVRPLKGIRVLPYYGCLVARPFRLGGTESHERPMAMERLVEATGAQPVFSPYKVDCCGGTLLISREKVALKLCGNILKEAKKLSPDCIVVACPLCHFMLDAKQRAVEKELGEKIRIPVLYITQLIGIAMGIDYKRLGLHRLVTSPKAFLQRIK